MNSKKIDFFTGSQIESSLNEIDRILKTDIFLPENSDNLFLRPSFVHVLIHLRDLMYKSDYEDDVCFFFGKAKIYLSRHIIRAYKEATQALRPLL